MTGSDLRGHIKEGFNLNTIVALVGFLSMFATIISIWTGIQFRQVKTEEWQNEHLELHAQIKADSAAARSSVDTQLRALQAQITMMDQINYRVTSNEKSIEGMDTRISRISESYSNQFGDVRTQLANIATQQALANQALLRIERQDLNKTPGELRGAN